MIKRRLKWLVANALLCLCIYAAVVLNMKGASYVLVFFCWVNFICCLFVFSDEVIDDLVKLGGRVIPALVDISYDLGITLVLLWNDFMISGTVYFIGSLLLHSGWDKAEKVIKENQNENN